MVCVKGAGRVLQSLMNPAFVGTTPDNTVKGIDFHQLLRKFLWRSRHVGTVFGYIHLQYIARHHLFRYDGLESC